MSKRNKFILGITLFLLPFIGRVLWYYRGYYRTPDIPDVEEITISLPQTEFQLSPEEDIVNVSGFVLFDLSHENNLEIDDLTSLHDRLISRGVTVENRTKSGDSLEVDLRGALALVIAAPTSNFSIAEREAIAAFVEDGGRLLLAADPTRPVPPEDDYLESVLFPTSAIPVINSLANLFGVNYFDDYLYNLDDNEGNYRNIRLSINEDGYPLTQDIDQVVFFAAHSLQSDGIILLSGDENTLSPLRTGEKNLAAAVLTTDERVLALGDVTFLTPTFHTVADNELFLGNIADWLVAAERMWDIKDFPYLFKGPVDVVPLEEGPLDPRLFVQTSKLWSIFKAAGLEFGLRSEVDPDHDVLFVGTFADAESVEQYLDSAGVMVVGDEDNGETTEDNGQGFLEIEEMGKMNTEGTSLFVADLSGEHVVVVVLGQDFESAIEALQQLAANDFSGCIHERNLTVCSTGEAQEKKDTKEDEAPSGDERTEGSPRIGSITESKAVFDDFTVPLLESLAEEEPDITSQPGDTYRYTIEMEESQDVLWFYGWCAETEELLKQNMENIELVFTMNGQTISLDKFGEDDESIPECMFYYALLTDWPPGEHLLTISVTFEEEINDGIDVYPAGTHIFEYQVTVKE